MKNVEKNCSRSVIKNRTTSVLLYYMHKPNKVRKSQRCKVDVQTNAHSLCCSYIYLWPFNQILKLLAVHHLLCKGKKSDCVYCDDPGTHKGLSPVLLHKTHTYRYLTHYSFTLFCGHNFKSCKKSGCTDRLITFRCASFKSNYICWTDYALHILFHVLSC